MPEKLKPELLPCDFCAHDTSRLPMSIPIVQSVDHETVCVQCRWCGSRGPLKRTEDEAIAAWNNRPVSELERLAREVAKALGSESFAPAVNALAAFLTEPSQKGSSNEV